MPTKFLFWGVLFAALGLGVALIKVVSKTVYAAQVSNQPDSKPELLELTQRRVAAKNDVAKLAATAESLLKTNRPEYAKYYFARVSDLDLNLRDAAYGWAYAITKANRGELSSVDLVELTTAIDRGEKVDPFFVPLLELKLALAKSQNNQALINATQKRLDLLK